MCLEQTAVLLQALQTAVVIGALWYATTQVREAVRARNVSVISEVLEEIAAPPVRAARYQVLSGALKLDAPDALATEHERAARELAVAYDRVGFFVQNRMLPDEAAFYRWQGGEIETLWRRLAPLVCTIRQREARPAFCGCFEYLGTDWVSRMKERSGAA